MGKELSLFALFVVAIVYGLTDVLLRFLQGEDYFSVVFFFLFFSTILLLLLLKFNKGFGGVRPVKKLRLILPLGFFHASTWLLMFFAIATTSMANAVLGYMTTPIFVIVLSPLFLRERVSKYIVAALALSIVGVLLVFDPRNLLRSIPPVGVISGILAGFAAGMVILIGRKLKDTYSPLSLNFLGMLTATVIMFPFFLLNGSKVPNTSAMMMILLMGFAGVTGGTLAYYALRHVIAGIASIILLLEPLVAILVAMMAFLETPSPLTIVGAGLLVIADVIAARNQP